MAVPLHIQLLEILEHQGVGRSFNIYPFIRRNFSSPKKPDELQEIDYDVPHLFLTDLIEREMIDSVKGSYITWEFYEEGNVVIPTCVNNDLNDILLFYITSMGLDYLESYRVIRATKKANYSIIYSLIITLIFSIVTVSYTVINYNLSKDNYKLSYHTSIVDSINSVSVSKRLDTLTLMLSKLQESLSSPKGQKTSPQQKSSLRGPSSKGN